MFKILIVEDDRGIAEGIQSLLEQWGMEARQVQDFRNITGEFETYQPHLILLDIKLPSYDGYYWCGQLRQRTAAQLSAGDCPAGAGVPGSGAEYCRPDPAV